MAPFGPDATLRFPPYREFRPVDVYDPQTESMSLEDMVNLGQATIDRLTERRSELLFDANVSKGLTTVSILNSRGGYATYTKSPFSVSVHGTIVKDTDMLFVSDGKSSCHPILDTSEIVESVQDQLEFSKNIVPAPVGRVPVVFTPRGVAGALLSPSSPASMDGPSFRAPHPWWANWESNWWTQVSAFGMIPPFPTLPAAVCVTTRLFPRGSCPWWIKGSSPTISTTSRRPPRQERRAQPAPTGE